MFSLVVADICMPGGSAFCLNGGTCTVDQTGTRRCACPDGFAGDRCQSKYVRAYKLHFIVLPFLGQLVFCSKEKHEKTAVYPSKYCC